MTTKNSMQQFVVGGAVRDVLLGKTPKDIDFVWVGATPQDMLDKGFTQVGADFPVFLDEHGDEHALARTERKTGDGYHGFECDFDPSVTLKDDQFRRDLTINQLAVAIEDWDAFRITGDRHLVLDAADGLKDLNYQLIRHVSDHFEEDPVRILRTARFASRYKFNIHYTTVALMRKMVDAGQLDHVTKERVWVEFEKAFKTHTGSWDFLKVLEETRALKVVAPQIAGTIDHSLLARLDVSDNIGNSVAVKCAMVTSNTLEGWMVWEDIKAPKDVIDLAMKTATLQHHFEHNWKNEAGQMLIMLKLVDVFRNADTLMDACVATNSTFAREVTILWNAWTACKDVSFADLHVNEQVGLEGKNIGEAIDNLRLARIEKM